MNTDVLDRQLFTNAQLAELLREWEKRDWKREKANESRKWDKKYDVHWKPASAYNPASKANEALTIEQGREVLIDSMRRYYDTSDKGGLLITAQAGMGKSTAAILFAQEVAKKGGKVLYLMPRHSYWNDIVDSPFFDGELWYHWKATHAIEPETGETMCRLSGDAKTWMGKGYKLIDMCKALCLENGHMQVCPYRLQAKKKKGIIAGVHQHATTGLAIKNFDLVIIDELPVGAFVDSRLIKTSAIDTGGYGATGELLRVTQKLAIKAKEEGIIISRKELLKHIAKPLREIYDSLDGESPEMDEGPEIIKASDVEAMREWFLPEYLALLIPELIAYEKGLDDWMSRVFVDENGLNLMLKKAPWPKLPPKIIALDATGRSDIYEIFFGTRFTAIEPNVRMKGKLIQVANRLNSISTILKDETDINGNRELTWRGRELLAFCEYVKCVGKYKRVGVVTFKGARWAFEEVFGKENVLHFGGSRGTNSFMRGDIPVDCIIIAGTPAPPDEDLVQLASQVYYDPTRPDRSMITINGDTDEPVENARSSVHVEYPYIREDGKAPYRLVGGFWDYGVLKTMMSLHREDEIRQSLHRGRPLTNECDVWLMTTIPTPEVLSEFHEKQDTIFDNYAGDIGWRNWLRVEQALQGLGEGEYTSSLLASVIGTTVHHAKKWAKAYAEKIDGFSWNESNGILTIKHYD